jgi:hypothetical protein
MATQEGQPYNQPSLQPTAKVTSGLVGGAIATIICTIAQMSLNIQFPPGFEAAVAVVTGTVVAYYTKDRPLA